MRQGVRKEYAKGTRRHHWTGRYPIQKFLQSRLGHNWDDVHSELSQEFDRRTYAGYLFWRSFNNRWGPEVATNCWVGAETGTIYGGDRPVEGFYKNPKTGVLSYQKPSERPERQERPPTHIVIDDKCAYEKMEGIWYYVEFHKNDYYNQYYNPYSPATDLEKYDFYNKPYTVDCRKKRQLSHRELKANNLTNDSPEKIREDKIKQIESKRKEISQLQTLKAFAAHPGV